VANTQGDGGSNAAIVAIFAIVVIVIAVVVIFVVHPFGGTKVVSPGSSAAPSASVAASVKTSTSP
jgi:hypothetical protein